MMHEACNKTVVAALMTAHAAPQELWHAASQPSHPPGVIGALSAPVQHPGVLQSELIAALAFGDCLTTMWFAGWFAAGGAGWFIEL